MTALALPRLRGVPTQYRTQDDGAAWCTPALLALVDADALSADDARHAPATPAVLLQRTLQRHWDEITAGARIFDWHLSADPSQMGWWIHSTPSKNLWIAITPNNGNRVDAPLYYLGPTITTLENIRKGLGQTVLAVFYDALHLLPNTLTPADTYGHASWVHWHGETDETTAIQCLYDEGDFETMEQAAAAYDGPTREALFEYMPEWAAYPRRVLNDRQVRRIARRNAFASKVVDAVDAIWNHVRTTHAAGGYADCGVDADGDSITWIAIFRWHPEDLALRIADDFTEFVTQGDYQDASTLACFESASDSFARWLQKMRTNGQLARLVENLVDLIAMPDALRGQIQITAH
ncbi:PRTRC system protein F [Ralstonia pseudosolanacearum]|uniref:PRTRC system protein F n=1 Tax=Ralstonia pseudosolanacearum TaxID=1310165 RepID=UPI001FFA2867|nr:PRTRC system protein F [Ralstonia pseudosolanacearum]